jgi:hypothetical protein
VQPGFLSAGQKSVAVLDGAGQNRQTVGLEFGQADDHIRIQHGPGDAYLGTKSGLKGSFTESLPMFW